MELILVELLERIKRKSAVNYNQVLTSLNHGCGFGGFDRARIRKLKSLVLDPNSDKNVKYFSFFFHNFSVSPFY